MARFSAFLALFALCGHVLSQSSTADQYLAQESPIAKANLLANIGPGGKAEGAGDGVVIASPSKTDPPYFFTWTRDTSLVFGAIIDQFTLGLDQSANLRTQIDNFITSQARIQQISNPSGTITTGGLGEPKFEVDFQAFTGAWGRPQRDGPALRASAMTVWANFLLSQNNVTFVQNTLWPIIQRDLDYVAQNWNQTTFDLWEEVSSSSFFTTAVQHRSLRQGATLATKIGQTATTYSTQADNLLCFLQSYWNTAGYVTANTGGGRSGKDANTVLASIHTFDAAAGCDSVTFQPCSDRALSNLVNYVNAFRSIYGINSGIAANQAVATGRYPEDSYFGGNPWYLTTLAVAEQLYDALIVWNQQGSLDVTSTSLAFFRQFDSSVATGTYASTSAEFTSLTTAVKNFADGFVNVVAKFTPSNGGLSEQYSKSDGTPVSAVDLTWSYAATLTAIDARQGVTPASWGARGLTVPTQCQRSAGGGGGGGAGTVAVTFNVHAETVFGENIFLTGSVNELQNWSPDNALALNADNYPTWSITVNLPASTQVEYKYIRKFNGAITWESDPNNVINVPASGTFTENDTWR
ncbi:glucoamylase [Dendrothele bispora CBS 962.96]|uniref:Glucoamylase n=1 Tax=Dendrothele bispora (strain CBS 962.96) TaxID=1314807 RepID=A0A4S8LJK4_DENBC|nr:glucoamylase [Dendrothele bispora CBS 962.96]